MIWQTYGGGTTIVRQLGCATKFNRGQAKRQLHQVILDLAENERKTPVIIIDEAHLLDKEMLEEMRFLLNFRMDFYNSLKMKKQQNI